MQLTCHCSQQLPELDPEAETEAMAEEFMRLSSLTNKQVSLPALALATQATQPSGLNIDFSTLVHLRRLHQTRYAAEGVRTRDVVEDKGPEDTVRRRLMRELNALLRQGGNQAAGTGQDRKLRWLEPPQGATGFTLGSQPTLSQSTPTPTGNSANAAVVAQSRVKKVSFRLRAFSTRSTNKRAFRHSNTDEKGSAVRELHSSTF